MGLTSRCTSRCAVAISSSRSLKRAPKRWDQRANHEVSAGFNSFCQLTVYHTLGTMVQGALDAGASPQWRGFGWWERSHRARLLSLKAGAGLNAARR